jgi:hypothetical protein
MDTSLLYIGEQFTIYGGAIYFVAGLFGNSMNIFIFASARYYRTIPCTFYFLVASIFNNLYILINLTSRIATVSSGYDLTSYSIVWCKARNFFILTLSMITLTCLCLATIDQFFVTSRTVRLRQCSNIKWAHRITFIVIIIWCLHGTTCFVFFTIRPISPTCGFSNSTYGDYISVFVFLFLCAIPIIVMVIFGCLAYRNIHQTRPLAEQQADRQMMRMVLIQIVLVVISNTPFGAFSAYELITAGVTKDFNRLMKETLAELILELISYSIYVVCIFFIIFSITIFF